LHGCLIYKRWVPGTRLKKNGDKVKMSHEDN